MFVITRKLSHFCNVATFNFDKPKRRQCLKDYLLCFYECCCGWLNDMRIYFVCIITPLLLSFAIGAPQSQNTPPDDVNRGKRHLGLLLLPLKWLGELSKKYINNLHEDLTRPPFPELHVETHVARPTYPNPKVKHVYNAKDSKDEISYEGQRVEENNFSKTQNVLLAPPKEEPANDFHEKKSTIENPDETKHANFPQDFAPPKQEQPPLFQKYATTTPETLLIVVTEEEEVVPRPGDLFTPEERHTLKEEAGVVLESEDEERKLRKGGLGAYGHLGQVPLERHAIFDAEMPMLFNSYGVRI